MNIFYRMVLILALMAGTVTVQAETSGADKLNISGSVGLVSNYVSSGATMSGDNASLYGTVQAEMYGVYAQVVVHTLQKQFFKKFQAEWIPSIGYQANIGDLNLYTQYDFYRYTGGTLFDGSKASDNNYDEWDIGFSYKWLYGEYSYSVTKPTGGGHDGWLSLGVNHDFGPVYVDASLNFQHYDLADKYRMNNFLVKVGHQFQNGIEPYAAISIGGQDADNVHNDNIFFVGVQYNF